MRHRNWTRNRSHGHWMLVVTFSWVLLAVMSMIVFPWDARAESSNGVHENLDRSNVSDLVIIGDSRIEMLAELNNARTKRASYNATVGAHHIYLDCWGTGEWENNPMVISWDRGSASTTNYLQQQKILVRHALTRWKSCKVVIVGTINDVEFENGVKLTVNRMKWLRTQLQSVRINGRIADVYFASIIPEKDGDAVVAPYNAAIKKAAAGKYIHLGNSTTWEPYYAGDGCHLTMRGSRRLYDAIRIRAR